MAGGVGRDVSDVLSDDSSDEGRFDDEAVGIGKVVEADGITEEIRFAEDLRATEELAAESIDALFDKGCTDVMVGIAEEELVELVDDITGRTFACGTI